MAVTPYTSHLPCSPWTTTEAVRLCCSSAASSAEAPDELVEEAISSASETLFMLSGQQFTGTCDVSIRPCSDRNCYSFYSTRRWYPVDESALPARDCTCPTLPKIDLGYFPVTEITSVLVDGVLLVDGVDYRLDMSRYLVRLATYDGNRWTNPGWPCCQRLDIPPTEDDTFEVQFSYGYSPPQLGALAARTLACEILKGCAGDASCRLPNRVTSVRRQGISVSMLDLSALEQGHTGVYEVDLFLETYNPGNLRGRTSVFSPDIHQPPWRVS